MCLRASLILALAVSVAACGRIGVHLQLLDGSPTPSAERDASTREGGADDPDAQPAGRLTDNIPVVVTDAGVPRDAATQDAGMDAAQAAGASDASQYAGMDAAQAADAALDAGVDAAVDAGMDSSVDSSLPAVCGGKRVFGLCWYLAAASTSCSQACSSKGGFDSRALGYVGTPDQGGSLEECTTILTALGRPATDVAAMRNDSDGLGCHIWPDMTNYWLVNPPFSPSIASPSQTPVRIACGCMR